MHSLKKGQINFVVELFIGAVLMLVIVVASYYFAGQSNIEATAIVYAQNSKTNCQVNLNTIMQSDKFLEGGTSSSVISRSFDKDPISTSTTPSIKQPLLKHRLTTIGTELSEMLPKTPYSLRIHNYCNNFIKDCKAKDEEHTLARVDSGLDGLEGLKYDDDIRHESCVYAIPVKCDPTKYNSDPPLPNQEVCKIFAEMRLNY